MTERPSVNLQDLLSCAALKVEALNKLAASDCGPLRLKKKVVGDKTVRYLGVRSWSTYFFEKIIASSKEVRQAKIDTQKAIDEHVRPFLHGVSFLHSSNPEALTRALQARVIRKQISPSLCTDVLAGHNSQTQNGPHFLKKTASLFHGTTTVPTGVSFAVVSTLKVIADVRLVSKETFNDAFKKNCRRGLTSTINPRPLSHFKSSRANYKAYYLAELRKQSENINSSVALELQPDERSYCSNDNMFGAHDAAKEFIKESAEQRERTVSIMLTVPNLPIAAAVEFFEQDAAVIKPASQQVLILASDSDSESSSE